MSTMYKWNVYENASREQIGYVWAWHYGSALDRAAIEYDYPPGYLAVVRADLDNRALLLAREKEEKKGASHSW